MPVQLKGKDTQSGDLRKESLDLGRQDGGFLFVGNGGGGNPIAPPRGDESNSDEREAGGGSSLPFLPSKSTNSDTDFIGFSVSKRDKGITPVKAMLNAGEDENGNVSEYKEEIRTEIDYIPDTEPDDNPLNEDIVYADSYGVGGNDSAYGGRYGGVVDASGGLYDKNPDSSVSPSASASKKKKMYILLIIALAVVVMVFLSRKKSKKRR